MNKHLLVIGDLIIDETYYVDVSKISPEAPIPTAELTTAIPIRTPGGAGFAAAWAASRGINTTLLTATDPENADVLSTNYKVNVKPIQFINRNVTKTRFIDRESGYHLLRLDNDRVADTPDINPRDVISFVDHLIKGIRIDACLLADYRKGLFSQKYNWSPLLRHLTNNQIFTLLDTRANRLHHWAEDGTIPGWIKLNTKEFIAVQADYNNNPNTLMPRRVITKGKAGATVYIFDREISAVPSLYRSGTAPDTTGCGDIFDVSFAMGMSGACPPCDDIPDILQEAVDIAGQFAYISLGEKLCSAQNKD